MTAERAAGRAEALAEVARALGWPEWPPDGLERLQVVRAELREILLALLDHRDFLGYQLSHANGGLDDVALDQIADQYLAEVPTSAASRRRRLAILRTLVPDRLDSDVLSVALRGDDREAWALLHGEGTPVTSDADRDHDPPEGLWARVRRLWRG